MTGDQIKPTRKPRKMYNSLNLKEPELFDRLMATAAKRKIGHKTLSGAVRYALEQWIAGN